MPNSRLDYDVVDVFASRPFAGNPLAVVHGGGELSGSQCLALSGEFNLSETTFPVPHTTRSYHTRIFTPGGEVPFAGHPTLGTAWVLRAHGLLSGEAATQTSGIGDVPVAFVDGDLVELEATPHGVSAPLAAESVARVLAEIGLTEADLAGEVYVASTGLAFVHLPVREESVARARPARRHPTDLLGAAAEGLPQPLAGIDVYAVSGDPPHLDVHARVFVPGLGIEEDPATGASATGLGIALAASGALPDGGAYTVRQGIEMGRPSTLHGRVDARDAVASRCRLAGQVHPVARGRIAVPPVA